MLLMPRRRAASRSPTPRCADVVMREISSKSTSHLVRTPVSIARPLRQTLDDFLVRPSCPTWSCFQAENRRDSHNQATEVLQITYQHFVRWHSARSSRDASGVPLRYPGIQDFRQTNQFRRRYLLFRLSEVGSTVTLKEAGPHATDSPSTGVAVLEHQQSVHGASEECFEVPRDWCIAELLDTGDADTRLQDAQMTRMDRVPRQRSVDVPRRVFDAVAEVLGQFSTRAKDAVQLLIVPTNRNNILLPVLDHTDEDRRLVIPVGF